MRTLLTCKDAYAKPIDFAKLVLGLPLYKRHRFGALFALQHGRDLCETERFCQNCAMFLYVKTRAHIYRIYHKNWGVLCF